MLKQAAHSERADAAGARSDGRKVRALAHGFGDVAD
jgi:hypothetical protein